MSDILEQLVKRDDPTLVHRYLTNTELDFGVRNYQLNTILHLAVMNYSRNVYNDALINGADINVQNVNGYTPIMIIVKYEYTDMLIDTHKLSDYDIDMSLVDTNNNNIIHLIVKYNRLDILGIMILDRHIDYETLNSGNSDGNTPLMLAVDYHQYDDNEVFNMLLSHPLIDVSVPNYDGDTVLHLVIEIPELLEILLQYKIRLNLILNSFNEDGYTPLMLAIKRDRYESARLLLKNCADVYITNDRNESAYTIAVSKGDEFVALIQEYVPNELCKGVY